VYLVAAVLVQQHQDQRHDDDHGDHDGGVQDGVEGSLADRFGVFGERRVDPAGRHASQSDRENTSRIQDEKDDTVVLIVAGC